MAVYTAIALGGNWSDNVTWGGLGHPVAGDTAIMDATSGNVTVDVASACAVVNCTGYTGTLALNAGITTTGNVTLVAGMTFTPNTQVWTITTTHSLTSAGKHFYSLSKTGNNAITVTLDQDLYLDGSLSNTGNNNANLTFSGFNVYVSGNVTASTTSTTAGRTEIIVPSLYFNGTGTQIWSSVVNTSSTPGFRGNYLTSAKTAGTLQFGSTVYLAGASANSFVWSGAGTSALDTSTNSSTLFLEGTAGVSYTLNVPSPASLYNVVIGRSNQFTLTLSTDCYVANNVTNGWASTQTCTLATSNLYVGGNLTCTGSYTGRTIIMNGTGAWSATDSSSIVKSNLTFNTAGTITIGANVYFSTGTITYTAGTIDSTTNSSVLNFANVNSTLNTNGMSWYNIKTVAMNAKTVTLSSALSAHAIDLTGTTTHTVLACGTNNVTLTGNWTNPKGTTGRTGNNTFIFNGTSTLSGATNFYNATINAGKTVTLTSGQVFAVTNTFSAAGTSGSQITFNTTTPTSTAQWNPSASTGVDYVNATDIDSSTGGFTITTTGGSITRTVNWAYVAPPSSGFSFFFMGF